MEPILDGILQVAGVSAVLVVDGNGQLVAHRGRAVYDRGLCEQLAGKVLKVAEAAQLQQEDWDAITAQYVDGKLLLRNLGAGPAGTYVLGIVADATLNASFATVAIRVATNKLKKVLAGGPGTSSTLGSGPVASSTPAPTAAASGPSDSGPLASSGLSWNSGSSLGLSRVQSADPAAAAFLTRCAKELARHVGPMAKIYVEEGVRRVAGDQPFAVAHAPKLLEDLSVQIEDPDDRAQFRKAIQKG